ncbi:MAG: hypothetical protein WC655_23880, partial [Candidatus Hydrogenedentales bacterium]
MAETPRNLALSDSSQDIETAHPPHARILGITDHAVFILLIGVLGILPGAHRYLFGFMNHLESLPPVFRLLDPTFAIADFFVNDEASFGPRFYYAHAIAFLTNFMPLAWVCFSVAWLSHTATLAVTYVAARRLFRGDALVAMLACVLVMSIESIQLGGSTGLKSHYVAPHTASVSMSLAALYFGILGRPYAACLSACLCSLAHPLVGAESGAIALATSGIAAIFFPYAPSRHSLSHLVRAAAPTLGACVLFGAFTFVVWILPSMGENHDKETLYRLLHIRLAHHYFPTAFGLSHYGYFACFLLSFVIAWRWWYRHPGTDRCTALRFLLPAGIVLILLVGGYLFVEVFPTYLWATAQVYRLNFILKWQGFLLFAFAISLLLRPQNTSNPACDTMAIQRVPDRAVARWRRIPATFPLGLVVLLANGL